MLLWSSYISIIMTINPGKTSESSEKILLDNVNLSDKLLISVEKGKVYIIYKTCHTSVILKNTFTLVIPKSTKSVKTPDPLNLKSN